MSRRARFLVGLVLALILAPLAAILWPVAPDLEPESSCGLGALAHGLHLSFDFTGVFVGAGIAVVGIGFLISSFFRRMPTFAEPGHRELRLGIGLVLVLLVAPIVLGLGWLTGPLTTMWIAQAAVLAIAGIALCASAARTAD